MISVHSDTRTRRLGTLAAIAAGGLVLVACGTPATPAPAASGSTVPTVAVDQAGASGPAAPTVAQPAAAQPAAPAAQAPVATTSLDGRYEIAAGEASTVVLDVAGPALTVLDTTPAAGWQLVKDDRDFDGVDLTYLRGADVAELDAEIDDGRFETDLRLESFPVAGPVTYQVSDAGSVTIEVIGDRVTLVGQEAAPGWIGTVDERELADGEVEIRFRGAAGAATDFDANVDAGRLEIDIDTTTGR